MWGVNPEARDWNVGALCLDFKLGEHKKAPEALTFGTLRKRTELGARGLFCSPKLKFEHRAPTFQSLVSG